MSSNYVQIARSPGVGRSRQRGGVCPGVGGVLIGAIAVGAAVAIYFALAQTPSSVAPALAPWAVSVEDPTTAPPERLALVAFGWPSMMAEDSTTAPPERLP